MSATKWKTISLNYGESLGMKGSISKKIFLIIIFLLAIAVVLQYVLVSNSFNRLYENSIESSIRNEFKKVLIDYRDSAVYESNDILSNYTAKTDTPIFAFDDHYEIRDMDLINRLRYILVSDGGDQIIIPCGYLESVYANNSPLIYAGHIVDVELVQIGNSSIWDPISINNGDFDFKSRTNKQILEDVPLVGRKYSTVTIVKDYNFNQDDDSLTNRAEIIYNNVKPCLVYRKDPEQFTNELDGKTIEINGVVYRFFCESMKISSREVFFITMQRITVTGFEKSYVNTFLILSYLVIFSSLAILAYLLSKLVARPLTQLTVRAEKMAKLDFSQKEMRYRGNDEIGRLITSVNQMSDNLESTLNDLQISNGKLEEAGEEAKKKAEIMKNLLADMAHEFKTPLGHISGCMDIIRSGLVKGNTDTYYDIMEESVFRLTDMVDETVELAKLQSGYWPVNKGNHELTDIMQKAVQSFQQRIEEKNFHFSMESCDRRVICDANKIARVVSNLMSNALKYSDDNKTIHISIQNGVLPAEWKTRSENQAPIATPYIIVIVSNSGKLNPESEGKIWQRYYSSSAENQVHMASQGIGLDIVRQILDAHNSEYGMFQKDGMICFFFTLQLAED